MKTYTLFIIFTDGALEYFEKVENIVLIDSKTITIRWYNYNGRMMEYTFNYNSTIYTVRMVLE